MPASILRPDWCLPDNVEAAISTRQSGNLASHVGDDPAAVVLRRRQLQSHLKQPAAVNFLTQQHSAAVSTYPAISRPSDAVVASQVASCAVLTADCLPILLCSADGQHIGAVHAGWRGLANGILPQAIAALPTPAAELSAYIGPAICQQCFEVGQEVRDDFVEAMGEVNIAPYFNVTADRWHADLSGLAESQARRMGVSEVIKSQLCSSCNSEMLYSHRRNKDAARFASIIWRKT